MPKRSVEEYKAELEDKIKSVLNKRNETILELDKINKELQALMEQQLALDDTKIRIKCINCGGTGYIQSEDGKKIICPLCSGKYYMWAEKYEETK